jgi:hypothetical protein
MAKTLIVRCKSRETARKRAPFVPAKIVKTGEGWKLFETLEDFRLWKERR